jgi:uncharacterized protein
LFFAVAHVTYSTPILVTALGLVIVTSLLFGAYHWWTGVGNVVEAALMGVLLMLFLRRSILGHYLVDIADFA